LPHEEATTGADLARVAAAPWSRQNLRRWTIGQNVSSGCIRLTNDDIIDLYNRTPIGTKVLVLATAYNACAASGMASHQR